MWLHGALPGASFKCLHLVILILKSGASDLMVWGKVCAWRLFMGPQEIPGGSQGVTLYKSPVFCGPILSTLLRVSPTFSLSLF